MIQRKESFGKIMKEMPREKVNQMNSSNTPGFPFELLFFVFQQLGRVLSLHCRLYECF